MDGKEMIKLYGLPTIKVEPRKVPDWEKAHEAIKRTNSRFEKLARKLPPR